MKKLVFCTLLLSGMTIGSSYAQKNNSVMLFDSSSRMIFYAKPKDTVIKDTMGTIRTLLREWQWAKRERGLYVHELNAAATVIQCVSPTGVVTDTAKFNQAYQRLIRIANKRAGQ